MLTEQTLPRAPMRPQIPEPPDDPRVPERSIIIDTIAQLMLSQFCKEEGVQLRRLWELDPKERQRFVEPAEFLVNFVLSEDMRETAIFAMADVICEGPVGGRSILDLSEPRQIEYYRTARAALNALILNLKDNPPDWNYREMLDRQLDAILPKERRS